MLIIFNFIGAGILILAGVIGMALAALFHAKTGWPIAVIGMIAVALDLLYRTKREGGSLIHPRRGGHVSFVPVWIIGLGFCFCGIVTWNKQLDFASPGKGSYAQRFNSSAKGYDAIPVHAIQPNTGLKVSMIMGSGAHGLALINGENFGVGETHPVKIAQKTVTVTCLEIREHSVLAKVDGETQPVELHLGESKPLAMAK